METKKILSPFSRVLSMILSMLIIFYMVPITVSAKEADEESLPSGEAAETVDTAIADDVRSKNSEIYEVVDLREANAKHFRLADGSYALAHYDYPVHYIDEYGDYVDIDNRLSDSGSEFSTENARVKFIKKITGNGNIFTLHENNAKITMGLVGAEKKTPGVVTSVGNSDDYIEDALGKLVNLENISSTIRYSDILDGVDIEYVVHSLNIKENIIVKERKDSYSYTFTIELNNLEAVLSDDGNVYISNTDGEVKYIIPAPVVYDADKVYAPDGASGYDLFEVGNGKYELTVTVSAEWMNDLSRAFPVTVDPPIEGVQGNLVDLYVDKNSPSSITGTEIYLKVSRTQRSYIRFDNSYFGSIPTGASIVQAQLNIIGRKISSATPKVGIYKVTSSWNNLLNYDKTQSAFSSGALDDNVLDYAIIGASGVRYGFDITELYEGWINGESNYGVALKLIDENTAEQAWFYSSEYNSGNDFSEPVLLVTYIYNDGLESYFPTSTHSAGVGGAGSINLATGRLTLAIPTLTTTDSLFGFTPTLVYNSSLAGKPLTNANAISPFSTSYLPYGYKLNLQEFIQKRSYTDSEGATQTYYALYDADGTTHTLYSIGGVIRDDSGLGLTLAFDGTSIVITDKSHTKKTYTSYDSSNWYLTSVTDNFGNKLIFSFDSSYRPTSVKVKPVGLSEITMLSFVYSGNMLSAVYNSSASEFVRLNCSGNYLSSVEYGIGNPSSSAATVYASGSYTYDSNGYITKITDNTANKSIEYGISGGKVISLLEKAGATPGQKMSFSYDNGCTFVNTSGNDEILGTNDDTTTQYVLDRLGRAVAINSYDVVGGTIYHSSIGVYGEFQAVAKNSLVETANIPTVGGYIEDSDSYTATLNGYIGEVGTYTHVFYDKTRSSDAGITYTESNKFRISGLAKANSVIQNGFADFSLKVRVTYTHGIATLFSFSFADAEDVWQMASGNIDCVVDDGTSILRYISKIEIICSYNGQLKSSDGEMPEADFDKISFVESSDVDTTRYTYDANGNLAIKTVGTYVEYYEYDTNGNVTRIANNRGEMHEYHYNAYNALANERYYSFHRIGSFPGNLLYIYPYDMELIENPGKAATQGFQDGINAQLLKTTINRTYYYYNSYGLLTSTDTSKGEGTTVGGTINSAYTYEVSSGSKIFGALLTTTDSRGYVTKYFYDSTNGNLLAEIDVSTGSGYVYTYDEIGRLEKVTPASGNATSYSGVTNAEEVEYTYDDALRLSTITTDSTVYTFTYDGFGNSTSVSAGNNTLATYEYNSNNGKLNKINYGNGFSEEYEYNTLEKLETVWYNYSNGTRVKAYSYEYTESGSLEKFTDHINGKATTYVYDLKGRFVSYTETKSSDSNYKNQYSVNYDDRGRVIYAANIIDYLVSSTSYNAFVQTRYQYNNNGTLEYEDTSFTGGGSIRSNYSYDELLRPTSISSVAGSFNHTVNYTYYSNSTKTENLISTYKSTVNGIVTTFGYTYDSKGDITKITNSGDDDITYIYDDLGQLISEVKGDVTRTYTYDNAGNIVSIEETKPKTIPPIPDFEDNTHWAFNPTETTTNTLGYSNSQWGDLLTSYNGTAITYDGIGNPLSYYNGTSYTFTWEGRRLVGAVKGTKTMSFAYNDEGIRTSKTVNGVTTTYYVNGGQIVAEKTDTRTIVYIYDATGAPIGMMYRTTSYAKDVWDTFWYEKNLQGDIIAVYNSTGTKVATYTYTDAWGNHSVSYSNSGASTGVIYNPFRYRGYYYDADLGMYYLQSRYYDAKICRFISADSYTSTGQGILGNNMFAYCNNDPVNNVDPAGDNPWIVIGIIIGVVIVATMAINIYQIIETNIIISNSKASPMNDEDFSKYSGRNDPTYGMTDDEQIAYIRKIRENNLDIANNWTEAEMLRELRYHESAYFISVNLLGSDPEVEGSLAYRLKHVDYESEQTFETYLRRVIGNLLTW